VSPRILLDVSFFAFGLVIGSYLNVVVHRLPRGLSTVLPRSRCPRCRAPIRAWDNLPVLSYLLLRGRCRHCGGGIAWRYPLVELLTGVCFVASSRHFEGLWLEVAVSCAFCAAMITLAMIDVEHLILPDAITLPGIVLGLVLQPFLSWSTVAAALIGALGGSLALYALGWIWELVKGVWGMGLGDVKMIAMIGAFLGWKGVVFTLFLGSLSGAAVGLALMAAGRLHQEQKLPFGVFLAFGALVYLFSGHAILVTYLQLMG
jgi:leader peptidase (prepilin peptidase) / N-methyltransferase